MDSRGNSLLETGWLLVAILAPLWVNLWARQPFDLSKTLLIRSLIWLMVGVWAANHFIYNESLWQTSWRRWQVPHTLLFGAVLCCAVTQTLATIQATDRTLSFYGSYERSQGLLTLLSYMLLFLLVVTQLRSLQQAQRLTIALVATAAPIVVISLMQAAGWKPFGLFTDARSTIYATLGRANFVGAYLAMLLPLTLAICLTCKRGWQRVAATLLTLLMLLVIGLTSARSAWLVTAVTLAVFGLLLYWSQIAPTVRRVAIIALPLATMGLLGTTLWLGRAAGSTAARLTIWQATLRLIGEQPYLGYGPDALGLVFPRVFPPQLVYYQGRDVFVDRAHNLLLDWTVTSGIVGLASWLFLYGMFFVLAWRTVQRCPKGERRILLIACLAAVSGAVAGNLVSFDVTATATTTWLLMAMTAALANADKSFLPTYGVGISSASREQRTRGIIGLTILLVGIGSAVVWWNIRPMVADILARRADQHMTLGDWTGAIRQTEAAIAWWSAEPAYYEMQGTAYLQRIQSVPIESPADFQRADAAFASLRALRPEEYRVWAASGEFYGMWANRFDPAQLPLAHKVFRQAATLAPNHARLYTAWGEVDLGSTMYVRARAKFQQAVALDATDGYAFWRLGDAALALNHEREALAAYQEAVHWAPQFVAPRLGVARAYVKLGQQKDALQALDDVLELDPLNTSARQLQQTLYNP